MQEYPERAAAVQDELLPDGSGILYHTGTQRLVTLNPTGALVWECSDGAHSVAMIVDEVREVFPDAPEIAADVARLLGALREAGMLRARGLAP